MEKDFGNGATPIFRGEILLCEDNEINQHYIKSHLSRVGFDVVIAENGREGVNIVSERINSGQKPFDLIFMDIQMPVMDGLEAAGLIAEMGVETPIAALTANVEKGDLDVYAALGMSVSLRKPFAPEELWECLYKFFTPLSHEVIAEEERRAEKEKQRYKLFSGFARRNQTTYEDICSALEAGDIKLAHRLAHTLRGLAGLMEKNELQDAARVVESALANGTAGALEKDALEKMGVELKKVLNELSEFIAVSKPEKSTDWDENSARELFDRLEPLLKADSAECRRFADALRPIPETGELITLLEDYEFEAAIDALKALRSALKI